MHPSILNFHTWWRYLVSFTFPPLYPVAKSPVGNVKEAEGFPASTAVRDENRKLSYPHYESNHDSSALTPVAQSLHRISNLGS
jgi:hypothetical protein